MARTVLPHKQITRAGVTLTADTAYDDANGNVTANDGRVFILAENTDAASQTVTAVLPGAVDGQAIPDRQESLAAGEILAFGPYNPSVYGRDLAIDASSNLVMLSVYRLP